MHTIYFKNVLTVFLHDTNYYRKRVTETLEASAIAIRTAKRVKKTTAKRKPAIYSRGVLLRKQMQFEVGRVAILINSK